MWNARIVGMGVVISAGLVAAGSNLMAQRETTAPVGATQTRERVQELARLIEPHWSDSYLRDLDAEATPEQSIYLSAVALVNMEREQGDVSKAEPYLLDLAKRAPSQSLKSAIRRMLVNIELERKDYKGAEKDLKTIVDENLAQF